ncbi:MAG: hypothetical protein ACW981_03410 [Candidatus Hodarchaeales archaeon]
MANFEKWFNSSFDLLEQKQNYQAIRNFNGAIFRVIASNDVQSKEEILNQFLSSFLEKLSNKNLNHEIFQVISYYFSTVKKHPSSDEYFEILFKIPFKNPDILLGIKIVSVCLILIEQINNEEKKRKMLEIFEKEISIWNKSTEINHKIQSKINIKLITIRIYLSNQKFVSAHESMQNLFSKTISELNFLDDDDKVHIFLIRAYLLALVDDLAKSFDFLDKIKTSMNDIMSDELFKIGLDILPSIRASDSDWFVENKEFVFRKFRNNQKYSKLLNQVVIELQKKYFPETFNQKQLLDFL